jgi:hypothetical protein
VDKYVIDLAYQRLMENKTLKHHETQATSSKNIYVSYTSSRFTLLDITGNDQCGWYMNWTSKAKGTTNISKSISKCLYDHFGNTIHRTTIRGFTEIKKDGELYRADIDYKGKGCWYDNIMVLWESATPSAQVEEDGLNDESETFTKLIPAQLRMIFQVEDDDEFYAVIHSCHAKCHKLSVLSYVWLKEYVGDRNSEIAKFRPYAQQETYEEKEPLFRIISCESIHSHCLLMPMRKYSNELIQIAHPTKWANAFYHIH